MKNLPQGEYEIRANGRPLGKASADTLSKGLNIASMTGNGWEPGGPWDAQSGVVKELVDARDKLAESERLQKMNLAKAGEVDAVILEMHAQQDTLVELQRHAAKPVPYHFSITPAAAP